MADVNLEAVVVAKDGADAVQVGVLVHDDLEALLASESCLPRLFLVLSCLTFFQLQPFYHACV